MYQSIKTALCFEGVAKICCELLDSTPRGPDLLANVIVVIRYHDLAQLAIGRDSVGNVNAL